jgi:hypothetical protein
LKLPEDIRAAITAEYKPPVIIIGMHRSGTSLLSRLLEECGIFQGYTRDGHNESLFFQGINENIFRQEGLNWDHPEELHAILSDPGRISLTVEYVMNLLDENLLEYFWGPHRYRAMQENNTQLSTSWGWKDPRNTITLPVWQKIHPQSKVIHIIRNGIDVAASLWRREISRKNGKADPHYSSRCQTLNGCFELWQSYVHIGRDICRQSDSAMEIYYENLVSEPEEVMGIILNFLDLEEQIFPIRTISSIDPERGLACLQDDSLREFHRYAAKNRLLLDLYGELHQPVN